MRGPGAGSWPHHICRASQDISVSIRLAHVTRPTAEDRRDWNTYRHEVRLKVRRIDGDERSIFSPAHVQAQVDHFACGAA
jgi:hypothetical protein